MWIVLLWCLKFHWISHGHDRKQKLCYMLVCVALQLPNLLCEVSHNQSPRDKITGLHVIILVQCIPAIWLTQSLETITFWTNLQLCPPDSCYTRHWSEQQFIRQVSRRRSPFQLRASNHCFNYSISSKHWGQKNTSAHPTHQRSVHNKVCIPVPPRVVYHSTTCPHTLLSMCHTLTTGTMKSFLPPCHPLPPPFYPPSHHPPPLNPFTQPPPSSLSLAPFI